MGEGPAVIARVRLGVAHGATGEVKHYYGLPPEVDEEQQGRTEVPGPVELRITQYEDVDGFYLFYCDEDGVELTDTYHDCLADAMRQAEREFNVREDEWEMVKQAEP
jgi:hypothetical protein